MSAPGSLDRSLLTGLAWTGAAKWSSQLLTWATTLIVVRLLEPEDYGLVSMAGIFLGLVTMVNEFGLGTSIVVHQDLDARALRQLNGLALVLAALCTVFALGGAEPLGRFFEAPALPAIVMVMSAAFGITGLRTVPGAVLRRKLRFRALALIEGAQAVAASLVALALAFAGAGVWALVASGLAGQLLATVLTVRARPLSFAVPDREVARVVAVSADIIVARIAWFAYSKADYLIAGKLLGTSALGAYTLGWTLASMPVEKVTALVGNVAPAIFAAARSQPGELRRHLLNLTETLSLVTFPLTWGIALVAEPLVLGVLGEKWGATVAPLRLLALYAAFRSITPLLTHVLNVTGQTRFARNLNLLVAALLPLGFWLGSAWGTVGIAAAWIGLHPVLMAPLFRRAFRAADTGAGAYLRALWPALSSAAVMALTVAGVAGACPPGWPPLLALAVQVAAGALGYAAALLLLHRPRMLAALALLRSLRRG